MAGGGVKAKRVPNPPQKCIFCGGGNISKEHIYADWMRPYLLDSINSTSHRVTTVVQHGLGGQQLLRDTRGPLQLKGDHRARGLKVVCKSCNEGWMSSLQTAAKPALLPLLLGEMRTPNRDSQRSIAAWSTMLTMVYEFADPFTCAIPRSERVAFAHAKKPPHNWLIWIAKFSGTTHAEGIFHRGIRFSEQAYVAAGIENFFDTQITIGAPGSLFFMTLSSSHPTVVDSAFPRVRKELRRLGFTRIFPPVGFHQNLPVTLRDTDFSGMLNFMTDLLHR